MIALLILGLVLALAGGSLLAWGLSGYGDELDQLTAWFGVFFGLCGAGLLGLRHAVLQGWIS